MYEDGEESYTKGLAKWEAGLNDMAGGKIDHKQPRNIRSDTVYEKRQRQLVDKYQGKWDILFIIGNGKTCMGGCCEDKPEIEKAITRLLKDRSERPLLRLRHPDVGNFLQGNISMMIPMPVRES